MKIAFDGTVLHGRKSGVGYYCEELLKALLAVNHTDEFFVFSHLPVTMKVPSSNGNLKFSNSISCPVRAFYLHALLPMILDQAQPDLCHYTNFLAPISQNRPYVVTIHDMGLEVLRDAHPIAKRLYTKRLIPHVARKARLIITNSEYSKWEIVRYLGIPEDRIRVTPLAASPEFKPKPVHPQNPYFLYVGNLEPRKNLERLIEAFARLPNKDHQLVIAGGRWYRGDAAERKARSLGLDGRVRFAGYVPREQLPEIFSGATALVYPSLLEGFGLPVLEAMACGSPVITSDNSALREIAGGAAMLVDPRSIDEIAEAMANLAENAQLRDDLSRRGLSRAAEFSWATTARLTLDAYQEAATAKNISSSLINAKRHRRAAQFVKEAELIDNNFVTSCLPPSADEGRLGLVIRKTIEYAKVFQYPLTADELRERLFDVEADEHTFKCALRSISLQPDEDLIQLRAAREKISDGAIQEAQPHLHTLASMPFIRMLAFSGSTAHRNMTDAEDLDLFMIVEDGKLWAMFLVAMVWAKSKGLRKRLCMNYVISDAALPLSEHDAFTAQQVASLKPIYGKAVYDEFISMNPFVRRCFPNFEPSRHRSVYPEVEESTSKRILERILRGGPIQILERISRFALGRYLRRKALGAARNGDTDVVLDNRRLKLHLRSHKFVALQKMG